jgi:cell division protein FtsZ
MIELPRLPLDLGTPRIKVLGLGNAGCNALDRVVLDGLSGADAVAVNTDSQALAGSIAAHKLQIGPAITRGLGAGGDPELGRSAADDCRGELREVMEPANIIFVLVGLGGGTGSGAAPLLAQAAREHNALVVGFATMPFSFEGKRRSAQAQTSLAVLRATADVVICFENDRMADGVSPTAPIQEAFAAADETISQSVRALVSVAGRRGLVHAGFDEIAAAVRGTNTRCLFGYGEAMGDNRAHEALALALKNPLLDRTCLRDQVENVIVSVSGGSDLTLNEVQILMEDLHRHLRDDARLFFGCAIDPQLAGKLTISVLGVFETDESMPVVDVRPYLSSATESAAAAAPAHEEQSPELPIETPAPTYSSYGYSSQATEAEEVATEDYQYEESEPEVESQPEPEPAPIISTVRTVLPPTRPPFNAPSPQRLREQRAEQMQLEPINRGRFEKSEPTIVDGQDLDVPTFLRRKF